ncbi:MAG: hypothetical protein HDT14_12250 [Oscillibacter sp.]|nr:hypothetical protein [Oscillibacter sp.]
MRKIEKGWIFPLLCLLLAAGLTACGTNGNEDLPPEQEEGVLIYAALNPVSEELSISIKRFNLYHEDVQIRVQDYSDENGMERLFTELSLGRVPDIMEMHRLGGNIDDAWSTLPYKDRACEAWLPYRQLAQKGYLEDLWPYIENDPALGLDGVLMPPLKAAEVNGGLYMIFPEVSITTLMGPEHIVGGRCGWTLDELMETYSAMPEGSTILRYNTNRWDMFSMLCAPLLEQYVDMETGENSFDSQGFRDMVEFLDSFPEEVKTTLSADGIRAELIDRILSGEQMLDATTLSAMWYITYDDLFFGAPVSYIGYPTADGSLGSFFNLHGSKLAMSSACRNKEAAWEFMRKMLTAKYDTAALRDMDGYGGTRKININLANYNLAIKFDLTYNRWVDARDPDRKFLAGPFSEPLFEVDMPDEDDLIRFETLLNDTTQIYWPENDLSEIVWESIGPYFAGDRTMDETIQMVQNRVGLYLNENR